MPRAVLRSARHGVHSAEARGILSAVEHASLRRQSVFSLGGPRPATYEAVNRVETAGPDGRRFTDHALRRGGRSSETDERTVKLCAELTLMRMHDT